MWYNDMKYKSLPGRYPDSAAGKCLNANFFAGRHMGVSDMKKRLAALILLFLMLTMSSCMRAGQFLELSLCGAHAVPGMFQHDLKGGSLKSNVIEEDPEGRILFELTGSNIISGELETVLVICQHIDADYVYFYEDECYLYPGYSKADIDLLKTQNDWGLPLNRDKMSVRSNSISLDLFINTDSALGYQQAGAAIQTGLGNLNAILDEYHRLDANPNGWELYWVNATVNNDKVDYYVIVRPDSETAFLPETDDIIDPNELAAFKQENGWFSGE